MPAFGLTPAGFSPMRQSDILEQQQAQLQQAFGQNVNFSGQSVLGQMFGIVSRDLALIWEVAEAVYSSQYPSGAEGTSVDNILALSNNKRKAASPTKTAPTNTSGVPGLVFYGAPGTTIPANSIITVQGNSALQFKTDADVTIAAAVNAIQKLVFSAAPDVGAFQFTIVDPAGRTLTSASLPWYSPATAANLTWQIVPTSGSFQIQLVSAYGTFTTPSRPFSVSAATVQADIRALAAAYSGVTVAGSVNGTVLSTTGTVTNGSAAITGLASTTNLVVGVAVSGTNIPANTYIVDVVGNVATMSQSATGSATETVTFSGALLINWGSVSQPTASIVSSTLDHAGAVVNSLQSAFNTLFDSVAGNYPYTDVTCTGSIAAASVSVNFGAGSGVAGQPVSSAQAQSAIAIIADTLQIGSTVVNINVQTTGTGTATGAPAQATGSATCTQNGPNVVPASFLAVIGSPVGGWAAVTNLLDCITGSNAEKDTVALARRNEEIAANAAGPAAAIAGKVEKVAGVVKAVGFANTSLAALQVLTFSAAPTSGAYVLGLNGGLGLQLTGSIDYRALANVQAIYFTGTPTGGSFTITINGQTTAAIPNTANAGTVQAAVQALTGFGNALVTGSFALGFLLAFGAGAAQQYPITATDSLIGASISAAVPSIQAKINAVPGYGSATVIGSYAAGIVVAFNASTGGQPQAAIAVPTNTLMVSATPVTITPGFGRPGKSIEIVVNDNNGEANNTDVAEAIFSAAPGGILLYGNNLPGGTPTTVTDAFGNTYPVAFSRPTQVPFYVVITLQTDLTTSSTPKFSTDSVQTIQGDVVAIGNAFPMGGTVVGFGSDGLIGSFNGVPGILSYTLSFGTSPSPTDNANVQLLPEQIPLFESFNVIVSYQ